MKEAKANQQEVEELHRLEAVLREFKQFFDSQCTAATRRGSEFRPFAPQTVDMIEKAEPILHRLDELRALKPAA